MAAVFVVRATTPDTIVFHYLKIDLFPRAEIPWRQRKLSTDSPVKTAYISQDWQYFI
jgi:hypothetical protein